MVSVDESPIVVSPFSVVVPETATRKKSPSPDCVKAPLMVTSPTIVTLSWNVVLAPTESVSNPPSSKIDVLSALLNADLLSPITKSPFATIPPLTFN